MKDKLVSNKTGRLAKKIGFNWKCTEYVDKYIDNDKLGRDTMPDGITNSFIGKDSKGFTLPTQTTLHKYLMSIGYYVQVTKHFACYAYQVFKYNEYEDRNEIVIDNLLDNYLTYELALEDGLYQTLLLIKKSK